eukprot:6813612-Prymnesium_polylepis.1
MANFFKKIEKSTPSPNWQEAQGQAPHRQKAPRDKSQTLTVYTCRRTTSNKRPRVGNSFSFILDQADARGYDGEQEEQFDNTSQDYRFASDDHLSDDEEDSDLAQQGFHIQNMIALSFFGNLMNLICRNVLRSKCYICTV